MTARQQETVFQAREDPWWWDICAGHTVVLTPECVIDSEARLHIESGGDFQRRVVGELRPRVVRIDLRPTPGGIPRVEAFGTQPPGWQLHSDFNVQKRDIEIKAIDCFGRDGEKRKFSLNDHKQILELLEIISHRSWDHVKAEADATRAAKAEAALLAERQSHQARIINLQRQITILQEQLRTEESDQAG